jgi:hypothetical protein
MKHLSINKVKKLHNKLRIVERLYLFCNKRIAVDLVHVLKMKKKGILSKGRSNMKKGGNVAF